MNQEDSISENSLSWSTRLLSFSEALGNSNANEPRDRDFPRLAIDEIERNPASLDQIIDAVFPSLSLSSSEFYERLDSFRRVLPFGHEVRTLIALVWRHALQRLPETSREAILTSFPRKLEPSLFDYLGALPSLLESIPVTAVTAGPWFQRIRNALGQDRADSGYWSGIDSWTEFDPINANVLLQSLSERRADEQEIWCAARILATLRDLGDRLSRKETLDQIERTWPLDSSVTKRLIHYRSWIETARRRPLSGAEIQCVLNRLEEAETRETEAGFELIRVLAVTGNLQETSGHFVVDWLVRHCRSGSSSSETYTACLVAKKAIEDSDPLWSSSQRRRLLDLTVDIQPIPEHHRGAWMQLDDLLVALFQKSEEITTDFLVRLNDSNPSGVRRLLDPHSHSGSAFRELAGWQGLPTLQMELFSSSMSRRRLGLSLINSGLPIALEQSALAALPESNIALGLLQIRLDHLRGESACSLLLQLIPRIKGASNGLQKMLHGELTYQSKNLPGLCLEQFKRVKRPPSLLKEAIREADTYFQQLRKGAGSPLAAMNVPGLGAARRTLALRRQREFQDAVRKNSLFMAFTESVTLPYGGDGFASYIRGTLMSPTPFQSHSSSSELPRLDIMDSDGRKLRQHHTLQEIRALEAEFSNEQ